MEDDDEGVSFQISSLCLSISHSLCVYVFPLLSQFIYIDLSLYTHRPISWSRKTKPAARQRPCLLWRMPLPAHSSLLLRLLASLCVIIVWNLYMFVARAQDIYIYIYKEKKKRSINNVKGRRLLTPIPWSSLLPGRQRSSVV